MRASRVKTDSRSYSRPQTPSSSQCKATSKTRFYMDRSEQQLVHEFRHATTEAYMKISSEDPSPHSPSSIQSALSTPEKNPHSPMEAFRSSFISGKFSDLVVTNGSQKWMAHKVVIASQSSVLEAKISNLKDPAILQLTEYDPEATKSMLEYLYTATYNTQPLKPDFCLHLHIKVFNLASELKIAGLQTISCNFFTSNLNNYVTDLQVYFTCVKEIYSSTSNSNPGLRISVVEAAVSESHQLLGDDGVWARFREVLNAVPEFHRDVMAMLVQYPDRPVHVVKPELCEDCGPRNEGDGYQMSAICKGCGVSKTMEFL